MKRILLVEDCADNRALVCEILREMIVDTAATIKEAEMLLAKTRYDLTLLDIKLPDGDGLKFLSMMQEKALGNNCPTLILSGQGDISNKVTAFSLGAEDFVTKPFHPAELRARVLAKLRKVETDQSQGKVLRFGKLEINFESQRAFVILSSGRTDAEVTAKEFRLIAFLARRLEWVVSRETLLQELWGVGVHVTDRTIDTHISNLRRKIKNAGVEIEAVPNEGYRLVLSPSGTN